MCGRTSLSASPDAIAEAFGLDEAPELAPRFNIAPTQPLPIVRHARVGDKREFHLVRFGLIPFWERPQGPSGKPPSGARHWNARVESVLRARPFAEAAKKRRCLVVADAFYEWKTEPGQKKRIPYRVHFANDVPFALAGVWDRFVAPDGEVIESCAIVTGPAHGVLEREALHDRSPLFVPPERYDEWLSREAVPLDRLDALFAEIAGSAPSWIAERVSPYVNNPRNEGPRCAEPEAAPEAASEPEPASQRAAASATASRST